MINSTNLERFIEPQERDYSTALQEIKNGKKTSHWMWYIFPQLSGLGNSEYAKLYAIKNLSEANDYLNHVLLGRRLVEISSELLNLKTSNAVDIFGPIDRMKLHSSMTLFSLLQPTHPVFQKVLDKYFGGKKDEKTVQLLQK